MGRLLAYALLVLVLLALLAFVVQRGTFVRMMAKPDEAVDAKAMPPQASANEADPVVRKKRP